MGSDREHVARDVTRGGFNRRRPHQAVYDSPAARHIFPQEQVDFAFRELGRVVRTAFLLDYISDIALRQTIHAATNKSEAFNLFVQWVAFGGGRLLAENTRDEQRKMIKYHHLAVNLLIFHNVVTMTRALQSLIAEGHQIDEAALACLSPYQTEHINRFGRYTLK